MSNTDDFRREDYEAVLQQIEAASLAIVQPYGQDHYRDVFAYSADVIIAALRIAAQKEPKQ